MLPLLQDPTDSPASEEPPLGGCRQRLRSHSHCRQERLNNGNVQCAIEHTLHLYLGFTHIKPIKSKEKTKNTSD